MRASRRRAAGISRRCVFAEVAEVALATGWEKVAELAEVKANCQKTE